jgi:hypothetical protein
METAMRGRRALMAGSHSQEIGPAGHAIFWRGKKDIGFGLLSVVTTMLFD